jgi:hypothetical protein
MRTHCVWSSGSRRRAARWAAGSSEPRATPPWDESTRRGGRLRMHWRAIRTCPSRVYSAGQMSRMQTGGMTMNSCARPGSRFAPSPRSLSSSRSHTAFRNAPPPRLGIDPAHLRARRHQVVASDHWSKAMLDELAWGCRLLAKFCASELALGTTEFRLRTAHLVVPRISADCFMRTPWTSRLG